MSRLLPFVYLSLLLLVCHACQNIPSQKEVILPPDYAIAIDTLNIPSKVMQRSLSAAVILPSSYQSTPYQRYPVVYLLHGYSGNHLSWLEAEDLDDWADQLEMIIVIPDGDYNAWYIDSPVKKESLFATYVGQEIPSFIDSLYRTKATPNARAISGLSMGGHGAMYLGINYPEQFGAMSSMSGGLDLRPFPDSWELVDILGTSSEQPANWKNYSVINLLDPLKESKQAIFIDCGTEDFFFDVNEATHSRLLELGIPHDYIVRPGAHTWDYWEKILPYHLLFFHEFFKKNENG